MRKERKDSSAETSKKGDMKDSIAGMRGDSNILARFSIILVFTSYSSTKTEPEHRGKIFVWQIVCAYLTAHEKFRLKCSGSQCLLLARGATKPRNRISHVSNNL